MSRAGLDALLADADALASRLAADDPTDARGVVEGLAQAVRDLRDDRDRALELLGLTREDAERVDASLRAVAARLKP